MSRTRLSSPRRVPFAWATKPAANAWPVGEPIYISDIAGGSRWYTNGSIWLPEGGKVLLAQQSPSLVLTGNTTDHSGSSGSTRAIVSVPAGMLGANGVVEIETLWTYTNNANVKNLRVRFGGTGGVLFLNTAPTTSYGVQNTCYIRNNSATNAQKGYTAAAGSHFGSTTAAPWPTTGAIDTSVAQDVVIAGQLANTADSITLESYAVWVRPSA